MTLTETYAGGRVCYDADSHVLEPTGWILPYADPGIREKLHAGKWPFTPEKAAEIVETRPADAAERALAENDLMGKGWGGVGAWDSGERVKALDAMGFRAQLVFSTMAPHMFQWNPDPEVFWGGVRAHNRAMADFCSADPKRLLAVGYVPFSDWRRALEETQAAIDMGCKAILVNSRAPSKEKSPVHLDFDPIWGLLQDSGVPFMLHIGTGGPLVPKGFRHNGRPIPKDLFGGGENVRSKDYIGIPHWPQYMIQVMALDGVFDRFPGLRGGVIEQGCEWIVTALRAADHAQRSFKKGEPDLAALSDKASDYIKRAVKLTPFPKEDVGWVTEQVGEEMLLFASDYPHPEGGRDPIKDFEDSFEAAGTTEAAKQKFYADNFIEMMGAALS